MSDNLAMSWTSWNERIRRAKREAGLTDADISAALALRGIEIGRAAVNHWINGKRPIGLAEFFALCEVLGADPGEMLFNTPVLAHYAAPGSTTAASLTLPPSSASTLPKARSFKQARLRLRK